MNLTQDQYLQWLKNIGLFTTPAFAVFFAQLALGVDPKAAAAVAVLALYGAIADYLKKLNQK